MDFNMQRLPARIDITNRAYDKDNQEDGFVLTSARIVNAKPGSYLIPAATTAPLMTRNLAEVTTRQRSWHTAGMAKTVRRPTVQRM